MTLTRFAAIAALTLMATPAFAHTGFHASGFVAGLSHPFNGLDHVLVMAGIGIWAIQLGGRNLWLVPLAFVATMVLGAGLALMNFPLPEVELGIAGSVVVIGMLVGFGARLPAGTAAALIALMALFHGHAHGTELPAMASVWGYAAGFVLSTAMLHAIGLGLGLAVFRLARPAVLRAAGVLTALAGLAMVSGS
ncbi:HupE/UreJ family protein [Dongia rigui]|uniref:HupE/UreJ family protein n=1 Tax=Dongia rigui TaxID=940149 RepID=A0ABU5DYT5_9PROT|nr:HupE/UreJ family protein [Dongia rigui]MDY0872439.1 HupE/UreJ family protein [Dongia rigui]